MTLFLNLLPNAAEASFLSMQLSTRFAVIGKVYKDLQRVDQATTSMTYALLFHTIESSLLATNSDVQDRLISGMIGYMKDIFGYHADSDSDNKRKSRILVRDLIMMMNNLNHLVRSDSGEHADNNISNLLQDSLERWGCDSIFASRLSTISNTVDILVLMSKSSKLPILATVRSDSVEQETAMVGLEILHQIGYHIQDSSKDKQYKTLEAYKKVFIIVEESICALTNNEYNLNLICKLLRLAVSSFLVSRYPTSDFIYWVLESRYNADAVDFIIESNLGESRYNFDSQSNPLNNDIEVFSTSLQFCIVLYRFQLSSQLGTNTNILLDIDIASLERLVNALNSMTPKSSAYALSKTVLKIYLVKMNVLFYLDGEEINAARLAKLYTILCSSHERREFQWANALLLSSYSTMTALPLALVDLNIKTIMLPDEIESEACLVRLHISKAADNNDFERLQYHLALLHYQTQRTDDKDPNSIMCQFIKCWSSTTVFLAIAEFAKRCGYLESALDFFKHCFAACKTVFPLIVQAAREASSIRDFPIWKHPQLWSLKAQCLKRQQDCLERIAVLHYRLGNRRKAAEYGICAISLLKSQDMFMRISVAQKLSYITALNLSRKTPCRRCCELRQRRFLLTLLAAATPVDVVSQSVSEDCCSLSEIDLIDWMNEESANLSLERLADINTSKWYTALGSFVTLRLF
jgi:hypothetical protein